MTNYSDNEKDCPVCHSKNVQLRDTLQAQNESQYQHETFHNLLNRSHEPFSVVAEYFGRGLFNKIVVIDDQVRSIENPSKVYHYHSSTYNQRVCHKFCLINFR